MNINQEIKRELKEAFANRQEGISNVKIYKIIAEKYNVHPERVRKHHRMLSTVPNQMFYQVIGTKIPTFTTTYTNNNSGTIESTVESDFEPKSDIEIAKLHKIDLTKYKINSYWSKQSGNNKFTTSVNAGLINITKDLAAQKDILLKELKEFSPLITFTKGKKIDFLNKPSKANLLEIAIPDIHFGKMSHAEESGEDYDLKIAGKRFSDAIENIIENVNQASIERILFPIGNDMFNVDNMQSTTTGGTPQDTDTRFHKMIKYVKQLLIDEILKLSFIAPVDVVVVPGNHDEQTAFMLGEILDAFFHNHKYINVFNSPKLRKYYQYGNVSILLTHGDKEKHNDLGMIFAAEEPKLWAATKYRFIQLGHYHHNKKVSYLANDEFQGFQIQILPSLSPNDKWHYGKGFISLKQAKGFLYNFEKGLVAEYTYSI